jgi:hypothetical protein
VTERECLGWRAGNLVGWLAAVGATTLDERLRLRWAGDDHVAALSAAGTDPLDVLAAAWPSPDDIADMPIAKTWRTHVPFGQNPSPESFAERAVAADAHPHGWTLTSVVTDIFRRNGALPTAPFNPGAPAGRTLHDRLVKAHDAADVHARTAGPEGSTGRIAASADGLLRVGGNGLGFTHARLGAPEAKAKAELRVDPVAETLAFFALALLPVGAEQRGRSRFSDPPGWRIRQRGWRERQGRAEFCWPAWRDPLDAPAIDALLGAWDPDRDWARWGVRAAWATLRYDPGGSASTIGFGAREWRA